MWATVTTISVLSAVLFSILELFVAFLQAYIFTFLSALLLEPQSIITNPIRLNDLRQGYGSQKLWCAVGLKSA